jgi:iron complex outermembrane receptor protein
VRSFIVALTIFAAAWAVPNGSQCQALPASEYENEYKIEIARQLLTPALRAFAEQTGLQVGFFPASPADESIFVGPVKGTLTADAALSQLLLSSGLTYEWINTASIYIDKRHPQASTSEVAPDADSVTARTASTQKHEWPGDRDHDGDIGFVIVIGTRLSSLETQTKSIAVLNRQKIDSYGVSTLAELFEYLPQIPFLRSEDFRANGEQYADLRGLGSGTTQILINGRRVAGSATSFDTGGFDVNTVPLTAVQRIEVLLDSPSVSIGADAVGGAINIVLKDEIPQPTMEVRYGAAEGGAEERRVSFGVGSSGEMLRSAATLDVFQREHLLGAERDLTRNQDYRRFGSLDLRSLSASPGNIFSVTPANLPGLDSTFASIPAGSTDGDPAAEDFISTAGQLNKTSLYQFRSIVPEISRISSIGSTQLRLTPSLTAFAEFLGTHRRREFQLEPPTLSGAIVPASNAFNPFGTPVAVHTLLTGMRPQTRTTESEFFRAAGGVRTHLKQWEGEVSVAWIRSQAKLTRENELDQMRVAEALASTDPENALNVFREGAAASPAVLASLIASPRVQTHSSEGAQGYARAQGRALTIPGGEVTALVGSEWRSERWSTPGLSTTPHRTVSAAFAELQVPLISDGMNFRAARQLSLSLGARSDSFSDLDTRFAPQYALIWQPTANLKLRTSYAEGYRPPSLYELNFARVSSLVTLKDPKRKNVATFIATAAGKPDLTMSPTRSWTVGFDFSPISNLNVSAGYWRTAINDRVEIVTLPELLGHEDSYPGRVVRMERTPQDIEAGFAGTLVSADISPGNFGQLRASGADLNLSFTWGTRAGRFTPNVSATWYDDYRTKLAPDIPMRERVGIANELGSIPRWRAIASVGWSRGPLTLFSAAQFVSAYDDAVLGEKTGRRISSQTLFDMQASLQLDAFVSDRSGLNAVTVHGGITNLFDRAPAFAEVGRTFGRDPSQGTLKQRFWYVQLAKEF